jgi:hypothetical protein
MILDGLLTFTGGTGGVGNSDGRNDVPTTGSQTSSNIIDLGVGLVANPQIPSFAAGGGARDIGIGDDPAMKLLVQCVVGFAGGTSLQINIQGAPDNGSGAPGAFVVYATGPAVVLASLVAGARLFDIDMPRPALDFPPPRYLQLGYVSVGTFTGGLQRIQGYLVLDRWDLPSNANAVAGGYPAGINVAN